MLINSVLAVEKCEKEESVKKGGAGRSFDLPFWSCNRFCKGGDSLRDLFVVLFRFQSASLLK
jgi:hypothetical protein